CYAPDVCLCVTPHPIGSFAFMRDSIVLVVSDHRHVFFFFFLKDPATTEIYTLSLHDALPISARKAATSHSTGPRSSTLERSTCRDRKSTRLNSSHGSISYAVFCLKKKKKNKNTQKITTLKEQSRTHTDKSDN